MDPKHRVRKAVIPVAGNGTRFLPATKAMPKEMLTIVDRPVVQYAVDEAIEAGIEHIVFVTSRNKSAIEDHFDDTPELISSLRLAGKSHQVSELERLLPRPGSVSFTRQQAPLGLGHAVWCARDLIGNEPFALQQSLTIGGLGIVPNQPQKGIALTMYAFAIVLESHYGLLTRPGLHCAPLAHNALGTTQYGGTTRLSFGPFLTKQDVKFATDALAEIATTRAAV